MLRTLIAVSLAVAFPAASMTQTPQPFPRPGAAQPQRPATPPSTPPPATPPPPSITTTPQPRSEDPAAPSAASLGVAVYPGAQFIASYDAGRGQRYYLFGTTANFNELLGYYRTQTGEKGDLVFKDPPTHMFTGGTLARYREESMAFPPSVTVKDWSTGDSPGYPNPKPGVQPARFPTVIMIVPPPPGTLR